MKFSLICLFVMLMPLTVFSGGKFTVQSMYKAIKVMHYDVPEMTIKKFKKLRSDQYVLIDVREQAERDVSTLPHAISKKIFERDQDKFKDKIVIVYCTIGYRSAKYARKLKKDGVHAHNLEGSLLGWVHDGGKVVDSKGKTTFDVHVYGSKWNHLPDNYKGQW